MGAFLKRSAADPKLLEKEGQCVVFPSLDDLAEGLTIRILMCMPTISLCSRMPGRVASLACRKQA
ncbi:hypothetical protein, partial [Acidisoma sp. L85]|uniref:hypothetical protein n=1 Tax=Acidisoma sp. L85 TaxID=1641850 RepID=UPI0020B11F71